MPSLLRRTAIAAVATLAFASAGRAATIAITEFIIDPNGADETAPEWIELFNYGTTAVDVTGWTLQDNSSARTTLPGYTIPSGGYAIVSHNRANFVTKWLGGVDDARVLAVDSNFVENNSAPGDGLILRDATNATQWSLGYTIDATHPASQYRATFLATNDFSVTNYGQPPQNSLGAYVVRNGNDAVPGVTTLGYEDNNATADPFAYASANVAGVGGVDTGSPLLGGYTVVTPEPASLAALAIGVTLIARRRR